MNRSRELHETMNEAIGFVQGVLVHAWSPAFHRIPGLYARLGDAFAESTEVREVLGALLDILQDRRHRGIVSGPREERCLARLEELAAALPEPP